MGDIDRRRQDAALGAERKPRLRKESNYNDVMSEKEWLKAIGAEDEDFEDDDDVPGAADDGAKKKSGKKQKRKEEDEDDEPKKKKKKSIFKKLQKQMRKLLEIVIQYE